MGLAVSNSLEAVRAGARQVECTINGIGERAGNAALEEVVMAMRVRKDQFGHISTNIRSELLYPTSRLVQTVTGLPLQRGKAIVGENAFAHESGIHQHGVMKNPETYEIMTPQSVGVTATNMVLGKHSGRAALAARITSLGFDITDEQLNAVFDAFKDLADRKKEIYDGDIMALVESIVRGKEITAWTLDYLQTTAGTHAVATATVTLSRGDQRITDAATGDGPVAAVVNVIDRICGVSGTLEDYRLRSVTSGRDAQGEVTIRAVFDGTTVGGKGLSTDIVEASAKAYIDAVNRLGFSKSRPAAAAQP